MVNATPDAARSVRPTRLTPESHESATTNGGHKSFVRIAHLDDLKEYTRYSLSLRSRASGSHSNGEGSASNSGAAKSKVHYHRLLLFKLSSHPTDQSSTDSGAAGPSHVEAGEPSSSTEQMYCMEAVCPHLGAPLSHAQVFTDEQSSQTGNASYGADCAGTDVSVDQEIQDIEDTLQHGGSCSKSKKTIVCPWHLYDFDLEDGESSTGMKLCVYDVRVDPDSKEVYVEAPPLPEEEARSEGEGDSDYARRTAPWEVVEVRGVSEEFATNRSSSSSTSKAAANLVANGTASTSTTVSTDSNSDGNPVRELPKTLISSALMILQTAQPHAKVELTRAASAALRTGQFNSIRPTRRDVIAAEQLFGHASDGASADTEPGHGQFVPPREGLVVGNPWDTERRGKGGSQKGRVAMLHALANIEQWAIDLAWDIIARFGDLNVNGERLPSEFFLDFARMAEDEAKHFTLLSQRLKELGTHFGSQSAHAGLWDSAVETSHSLLSRLAIIHLVAEARGLDVNPLTIEKFRKAGDAESVRVLEIIHNDEVTHVTTGHRWFTWLCTKLGLDPIETFRNEVKANFKGRVKGPFNTVDRLRAGMTADYYEDLSGAGFKTRLNEERTKTEAATTNGSDRPEEIDVPSQTQSPFNTAESSGAAAESNQLPMPSPVPFEASSEILPSSVPDNANAHCPGTESTLAGKTEACEGCPNQSVCAEGPKGPDPDLPLIRERMNSVKRKVLVLSGKGGVGKSTFTAGLSWALAADEDLQTGIMDVDICGPSIPLLMGLESANIHTSASGWSPAYALDNLAVMSIGFMLPSKSDAVIWRGPKKNGLIKQFLKDVEWGDLDYLVVDTPPGTSDEHLSIVQYLKDAGIDGAVLVTTPQEVALQDVRKEIDFCRKVGIPILGIVENMSGFVCPSCGTESEIFIPSTGGAEEMTKELGLELLGKVPLDPRIGMSCDQGQSFLDEYPDSRATTAYLDIVQRIRELLGDA